MSLLGRKNHDLAFGLRPALGLRTADFELHPKPLVAGLLVAATLHPGSLHACAACYGQSDSPMAAGMNWGILSLLAVLVLVFAGVAAFFVYLARRSAATAADTVSEPLQAVAGACWSLRHSAPGLGQSDLRGFGVLGTSPLVSGVGHSCARGRGHPGASAFGSGGRKRGSEPPLPEL